MMYITQKEVEKILDIMVEFPEANSYRLEVENSNGIGDIVSLTMDMKLNDRKTKVTIEIRGVEDW